MANITAENILSAYAKKGYKLYDNGSINIIGVRCTNEITDLWDDYLCDLWKENGDWKLVVMQGTTKPGAFQFDHNSFPFVNSVSGSALVKEGQYHSVWQFQANGHFGHDALRQIGNEITIYRIKEKKYDLSHAPLQSGWFGIDNHSVWNCPDDFMFPRITNWSEGCQLSAKPIEFKAHINRVKDNVAKFGNSFSYTLFNIADLGGESIV